MPILFSRDTLLLEPGPLDFRAEDAGLTKSSLASPLGVLEALRAAGGAFGDCAGGSKVAMEKRSTCLRCRGVRRGTNSSFTSVVVALSLVRIGDKGFKSDSGEVGGDVETVVLLLVSVVVVAVVCRCRDGLRASSPVESADCGIGIVVVVVMIDNVGCIGSSTGFVGRDPSAPDCNMLACSTAGLSIMSCLTVTRFVLSVSAAAAKSVLALSEASDSRLTFLLTKVLSLSALRFARDPELRGTGAS